MLRRHLHKKIGTVAGSAAGTQDTPALMVVEPGTSQTDDIAFFGTVQIEGCIEGDVRCNRLVVTRRGRIDGAVSAHSVTINGTVNGPIDAACIFLGPTAIIKGNLTYAALNVATGASISGICRDRRHLTTRVAADAALSDPPTLPFNSTKSACGKTKRALHFTPAGSMKAVWEKYQRNAGNSGARATDAERATLPAAADCAAS